jgi:hypothetical protein
MANIEIGEVVKQFELRVEPLLHAIAGKITRYENAQGVVRYDWSISHNYQPAQGAGVYYPSKISCDSLEEAEGLFKAYAGSFVPSFRVVPNESF